MVRGGTGRIPIFAAVAFAAACTVRPAPTTAARALERIPEEPEASDVEIERNVKELIRTRDVRNLALAAPQSTPKNFLFIQKTGGFPDKPFAYVRGFRIHSNPVNGAPRPDTAVPGCTGNGTGVIADDGTLCPEVLLPGVSLSAKQAERLLAFPVGKSTIARRVPRCRVAPHHSWVFYDQRDRPVWSMWINFRCRTWSRFDEKLSDEFVQKLRNFCRDTNMVDCDYGIAEPGRSRQKAALQVWNARYLLPGTSPGEPLQYLRPTPTGIEKTTLIRDLAPNERRLLCQWSAQHSVWQRRLGDTFARQENGQRMVVRVKPWKECVDNFPSCDVPLADVLPCAKLAQQGDPWFRLPAAETCRQHRACLWAYETRQTSCTEPDPEYGSCQPE